MKIKFGILYVLLMSLFLCPSCTDADLDTTMYGGREDTQFYSNLEEINQALTACYYYMKNGWTDIDLELMFINDCASDDCEKGGSGLTDNGDIYQLETFNVFTTNSKVAGFWNMAYSAIYQINTMLDKVEVFRSSHTDLTEDDKTLLARYENEARWLRGVWYFNLAYLWGDVPLFLHAEKPSDIYKPRTPAAQIWEQVIADFTAATALPKRSEYPVEDTGRVTSGAAYAMLGRTYWYNRDFESAYKMLYVLVEGEQKVWHEIHAIGNALKFKENLSHHQARHTFGTLLLSEGISIESIAKMMGHTNIATTQVYAKVTDLKISEDMDRLIERRKTRGNNAI